MDNDRNNIQKAVANTYMQLKNYGSQANNLATDVILKIISELFSYDGYINDKKKQLEILKNFENRSELPEDVVGIVDEVAEFIYKVKK